MITVEKLNEGEEMSDKNFKVGDKVKLTSIAAAFGIESGKFAACPTKKEYTVTQTGLIGPYERKMKCDLLLEDSNSYVFAGSDCVEHFPEKTITLEVPESMAEYIKDEIVKKTRK